MPCDLCGYFQSGGTQCRCGAVLPSTLNPEPSTVFDAINAELSGLPRSTVAESRGSAATPFPAAEPGECPFEPGTFTGTESARQGQAGPEVQSSGEDLDAALVDSGHRYYREERLAAYNEARWPLSVDHPRRGEWDAVWWISPAGFAAGDRVLFYAKRTDRPGPTSGKRSSWDGAEWQFLVDLDRGEFREWGKPWQSRADQGQAGQEMEVGFALLCPDRPGLTVASTPSPESG